MLEEQRTCRRCQEDPACTSVSWKLDGETLASKKKALRKWWVARISEGRRACAQRKLLYCGQQRSEQKSNMQRATAER